MALLAPVPSLLASTMALLAATMAMLAATMAMLATAPIELATAIGELALAQFWSLLLQIRSAPCALPYLVKLLGTSTTLFQSFIP